MEASYGAARACQICTRILGEKIPDSALRWLKPHWPEIEASIVRQAVTIERSADGNTGFVSPAGLKRGARGSKPVGTWVHLANLKLIH
jgi:hypothetical protein